MSTKDTPVKTVDPIIPTCKYCKQLVADPCETGLQYAQCNNEEIDFYLPHDFDPELN